MPEEKFNERLAEELRKKNLTQKVFAAKVDKHTAVLNTIIKGHSFPNYIIMIRIANTLDLLTMVLFTEKGEIIEQKKLTDNDYAIHVIRQTYKSKKLTASQFGNKIKVSSVQISRYNNNKVSPKLTYFYKSFKFLNIFPIYLVSKEIMNYSINTKDISLIVEVTQKELNQYMLLQFQKYPQKIEEIIKYNPISVALNLFKKKINS